MLFFFILFNRDALRFAFMELIRQQLNCVKREWNNHVMRRNRRITVPTGKPSHLWSCPHGYGNYRKHLFPVSTTVVDSLYKEYTEGETCTGVSEDIEGHFIYVMRIHNTPPATSVDLALSLYRNLIDNSSYYVQ